MDLKKQADGWLVNRGEEIIINTVAKAIFAQHKLGALSTNARLDYTLVKAKVRHCKYYTLLLWSSQLDAWTERRRKSARMTNDSPRCTNNR